MWKLKIILTLAFWTHSFERTSTYKNQNLPFKVTQSCKKQKDSVTKKITYITADKEAINEGGKIALIKQFGKITLDSIPDDLDTRFIIAFVVEADGQITGERILKDKTSSVGKQMIRIIKSFKWTPAECNGRKVSMLVNVPLQICLENDN